MCVSGIGTLRGSTFYTHGALWDGPNTEMICTNASVFAIPRYYTHAAGRFDLQPHTSFTLAIRHTRNTATLTVRTRGRATTVGPAQLAPLSDQATLHCTATSVLAFHSDTPIVVPPTQ